MSERRDELIDKIITWLEQHGVAGLSLRPLAEEVGSSARLLVYHFGSRDGLLDVVFGEIRKRLQDSFTHHLGRNTAGAEVMMAFWLWAIRRENIGMVQLLFEVQILTLHDPARYGRFLKSGSQGWLELIESALPASKDRRARATLCMAVIDGLLFEYIASGDVRRTTKALAIFQESMRRAT